MLVDMSPDVELHEPLVVEQEDQNPERTRAGAARPEEESPPVSADFADLLSEFEPGPGQGNVHGSNFMGFVPNQALGRCQTEGRIDAHMFIEEGYWDAGIDGPKPDREPEWAFIGGQHLKGWWIRPGSF